MKKPPVSMSLAEVERLVSAANAARWWNDVSGSEDDAERRLEEEP
jgi:hypothetical protein